MNHILVSNPNPACVLHITHPARAYTDPSETDVAKTWAMHTPVDCRDSYERVQQDDWMSAPGGFKS